MTVTVSLRSGAMTVCAGVLAQQSFERPCGPIGAGCDLCVLGSAGGDCCRRGVVS
jgi:hypothetical protein